MSVNIYMEVVVSVDWSVSPAVVLFRSRLKMFRFFWSSLLLFFCLFCSYLYQRTPKTDSTLTLTRMPSFVVAW